MLDKWNLHKNIEKVILESESKRFEKMIELFSQYYAAKQEKQKLIVEKVDCMITKIN